MVQFSNTDGNSVYGNIYDTYGNRIDVSNFSEALAVGQNGTNKSGDQNTAPIPGGSGNDYGGPGALDPKIFYDQDYTEPVSFFLDSETGPECVFTALDTGVKQLDLVFPYGTFVQNTQFSITINATEIDEDGPVPVPVSITNNGGSGSRPVYIGTGGSPDGSKSVTVSNGQTKTVDLSFNPSTTGSITLESDIDITASPNYEETNAFTSKSVTTTNVDYSVNITSVNSPFQGEDLIVNADVSNSTSAEGGQKTIELIVGGQVRDSKQVAVSSNSTKSVQLSWTTPSDTNSFTTAEVSGLTDSDTSDIFIVSTSITDWYDLRSVRGKLSESYTVENDIGPESAGYDDVASQNANGGSGWDSIGTSSNPFTGTFDGQENEIRELYVDRPSSRVGLIGKVSSSGVVKNTKVIDCDVSGDGISVAGLVAFLDGGRISNCVATGQLSAIDNYVGLVCGFSSGTIENCLARGSVVNTGSNSNSILNTGGVLGRMNAGIVKGCVSSVDVDANGQNGFGAVIGRSIGGEVEECIVHNCSINGGTGAGIIGAADSSPISKCFVACNLDNPTFDAGQQPIVGQAIDLSSSDFQNNYFDEDATGFTSDQGDPIGTALSTSQSTGSNAASNMSGISFSKEYRVVESGSNIEEYPVSEDAYPLLRGVDIKEQFISQNLRTFSLEVKGSESTSALANQKEILTAEVNGSEVPKTVETETIYINGKLLSLPDLNLVKNVDIGPFSNKPRVDVTSDGELFASIAREGDGSVRVYDFPSFNELPSSPLVSTSNSNNSYVEWSNDGKKLAYAATSDGQVFNTIDFSTDLSTSNNSVLIEWFSTDDFIFGLGDTTSTEAVLDVNNNYSEVRDLGQFGIGEDATDVAGTNVIYWIDLFENANGEFVERIKKYDADTDTITTLDRFGQVETPSRFASSPDGSLVACLVVPDDEIIVFTTSDDTEIAESPIDTVGDAVDGEIEFSASGDYLVYSESGVETVVYDTSTWNVVSSINEGDQYGLMTIPRKTI